MAASTKSLWLLLTLGLLAAVPAVGGDAAPVAKHERVFGFEELSQMRRDRFIDVTTEPGAVALTLFQLLFDETGKAEGGRFCQHLSDRVLAKKEFVLDDPRVKWCQLYWVHLYGADTQKTQIQVNGTAIPIGDPKTWAYGNWGVTDVPVDLLKAGANEFVFSGGNALFVENNIQPNRSARSVDGGKTWDYDRIGDDGAYNGEYCVRLGLGRYPPAGAIWSDGIDLASLAADGAIAPSAKPKRVQLSADMVSTKTAGIRFELRSGPTPEYDAESWDAWREQAADAWLAVPETHRFVQWRAILSTTDPLATPQLKSVALKAEMDVAPSDDAARITVKRFNNEKIIRSSYSFTYQKPSPRLALLRKLYELDDVVKGKTRELDRFVALRGWTRHQWDNGWGTAELIYCAPPDALLILDLAKRGKASAFCGHYATVFIQSAMSLGYTGRVMCARAHAYAEIWSNQFKKWIVMDPGPDIDDEKELNYHYELNDVPMSTLELHRRLRANDWTGVDVVPDDPADDWQPADDPKAMLRYDYFQILPRNNQLDSHLPGDLDESGWPSDADWPAWRDGAISDTRRDYPYSTNREGDLYWTLNQVAIYPRFGEAAGTLVLQFDTQTPNLKTYQIRRNRGLWEECTDTVEWTLRPGANLIEARTLNVFDVPGIVSAMEVEYAE